MEHKNIVKLRKVFENKDNIFLVMEYCGNGSLADLLDSRDGLSEIEIKYFIMQIVEAINYIHEKKVIHRDIKPANILLNDKMQVKIADFGLAAHVSGPEGRRKTFCGTPYFMAPEIVEQPYYGQHIDYWSIGIMVYYMWFGFGPFETDEADEVYKLIKEDYISYQLAAKVNDIPINLLELLRGLLEK